MPVLRTLALVLTSCLALAAAADEGMWMANQLPELAPQLRAAGLQGDPAALADLTAAPLSAVVKAGGGTGAFVSGQGLLVTNHHVAYGVIQYNSTPERNLLDSGFAAANAAGELHGSPDFRVLVTERFDRVTARVLETAEGKKGLAYFDAIDRASKAIVAECEALRGRRCSVATMDYGAEFYRIQQLELRDVRLVYAPPSAIGKYGDEIDNFMWPRHSGDFTLLRAYVGADASRPTTTPRTGRIPRRRTCRSRATAQGRRLRHARRLSGHHLPASPRERVRRTHRLGTCGQCRSVGCADRHHPA